MNTLRRLVFHSKALAPVKFAVNRLTQKEAATQQAIKSVGKENVTNKMVNEIIWNYSKYHFSFDEYFSYGLATANKRKKATYIPYYEQTYWIMSVNQLSNKHIFVNKQETYALFGKYYKREQLYIASDSDEDKKSFMDFTKRHPRFIVKPNDLEYGQGVRIIDMADGDNDSDVFKSIVESNRNGVVVEELIKQSDAMGRFHPTSVNTVRMITVRLDDRVEFLPPSCRFGVKGAIIDNASAGSIAGAIDAKTGIIKRVVDKAGHKYVVHPDTGVPLVGAKIPDWEEAVALAKELATVVPTNRYTGWDLAHTDDGWVMVEGNSISAMMCQYTHDAGCKQQMTEWFKEIGVKPFS